MIYKDFIIYSGTIVNNNIILIGVSYPYRNYIKKCVLMYSYVKEACNISIKRKYNIYPNKNLTYIAVYINIKSTLEIPSSIILNNNRIPIIYNHHSIKYNIILSIVNFINIKNYKQVVDVIEISKIYGVEHIVIHATSSTEFIKYILIHYIKIGFIEIIPFCLNNEINFVHSYGQVQKINEILYKYMYNTRYIIFNDIDEIIIPAKHKNYMLLLKETDSYNSDIYLFKSKLFPFKLQGLKSILAYKDYCNIKLGYEKYIVGNLYKFTILDVHKATEAKKAINITIINSTLGYVRHTRYRGRMCNVDSYDSSLDYLKEYLNSIYKKYIDKYSFNLNTYLYGIN